MEPLERRLPGDPEIEHRNHLQVRRNWSIPTIELSSRPGVASLDALPELGYVSRGKEKTFEQGARIRAIYTGADDADEAFEAVREYAFPDNYGPKFYSRSRGISFLDRSPKPVAFSLPLFSRDEARHLETLLLREVLSVFRNNLKLGMDPNMLLKRSVKRDGVDVEERNPKATHSILVSHRYKDVESIDKYYYNTVLQFSLLLHDVREDTTVFPFEILKRVLDKSSLSHSQRHQIIDDVTGVNRLLTRRERFYALDSYRMIHGGIKRNKGAIPGVSRYLAAIVKQEDRYVNNRSMVAFDDPVKRVKEAVKSLLVADYVGKGLLASTANGHRVIPSLKKTLDYAVRDNLGSLYAVLGEFALEQATFLDDAVVAEKNRIVYDHIAGGGLSKVRYPAETRSDESLDGLLISMISLLCPSEEGLKELYSNEENRESQKGHIVKYLPSFLRPPVGLLPRRTRPYDVILSWQSAMEQRLVRKVKNADGEITSEIRHDQMYLALFALWKVVQTHLLDPQYRLFDR